MRFQEFLTRFINTIWWKKCCVIKCRVFEQSPDASTVSFLNPNLIFLNYFILIGKHAWRSTHPGFDLRLGSEPSHVWSLATGEVSKSAQQNPGLCLLQNVWSVSSGEGFHQGACRSGFINWWSPAHLSTSWLQDHVVFKKHEKRNFKTVKINAIRPE